MNLYDIFSAGMYISVINNILLLNTKILTLCMCTYDVADLSYDTVNWATELRTPVFCRLLQIAMEMLSPALLLPYSVVTS